MHWWHDARLRGHLDQVLAHCNDAIDSSEWAPATHACDLYFRALNKYWNAFNQHVGQVRQADIPSFVATLNAMPAESKGHILDNAAVRTLVAFTPAVMNHYVLTKAGYVPGQEIAPSLHRDATEEHHNVKKTFHNLQGDRSETNVDRAMKRLAEFLYVIRSNLAHGEKSAYGPDLQKAERDRLVAAIALPVQRLILDLLLDRPDYKLAAYGSLQPGGSNAKLLEPCKGKWESCTLTGMMGEINGLPALKYSPSGSSVAASLLTSTYLPHYWDTVDRFEGRQYVRHLLPIHCSNGCVVANVYEQRVVLASGST